MKRIYIEMAGERYTLHAMQLISKLCDGLVHKEIGEFFGVAKGTIDHSVADLVHKAHVKNGHELVAHSIENGMKRGGFFNGKNLFPKKRKKKS